MSLKVTLRALAGRELGVRERAALAGREVGALVEEASFLGGFVSVVLTAPVSLLPDTISPSPPDGSADLAESLLGAVAGLSNKVFWCVCPCRFF